MNKSGNDGNKGNNGNGTSPKHGGRQTQYNTFLKNGSLATSTVTIVTFVTVVTKSWHHIYSMFNEYCTNNNSGGVSR